MKCNGIWQGILVTVLLSMMISPALAQENGETWSDALPEVMQQNGMTYTTGGFGLEERDALKASAKDYNLIISNAIQGGNFTEGETIIISGNNKTLTINDAGPLVYARLPSGTYLIKGINGKETTERTLAITDHEQARIHFIWSH